MHCRKLSKIIRAANILTFSAICSGLIPTPAAIAHSLFSGRPVEESFTWELTNARVVNPGRTSSSPRGTITRSYTIVASASGEDGAPIPKGELRLCLSAFSPSIPMNGQNPGTWYLSGSWTLIDEKAPPEAKRARHSAAVLRGHLIAELPFNPAIDQGALRARLVLPLLPRAGRWRNGRGTFTGNEKLTGIMSLTFEGRRQARSSRLEEE